MDKGEAGESQETKINKAIYLRKEYFSSSKGIFADVYKGKITEIVKKFNSKANQNDPANDSGMVQSQNDVLQLLIERDELGRTSFDIAW